MMFLIGQKVLKWSMAISLMFPKSLMSAKYVDGGIKKRDICFLIRKITWESEITNRDHHGLTHANERFKYFPCIIAECSQRFQKMKELMKHLRESHEISEENKATCRKCPEEFGKLKQFLIHVSRKHEIGTNVPIFPLFPALTHLQTPEQTLNFGQSLGNSIVEMMNDPDLSALVVPLLPTIQDLMNCDFRELTRRKPAGVLGGSQEEKEDEEDEEEDGEEDDDQEHEEIDTLRLK
ncbi:hypothetical protein L3Y34_019790 [Caenorhabditis briggsae]|uniref:C2H2-type domain-containing protein n=1 Tax=Caenorhabditis briggsae TaxID=6238 RepID=A0AAE9DQV9_CAEBR|nr:hypothetical protein L3Y34_019790 [Caenorhabditis briggsae]